MATYMPSGFKIMAYLCDSVAQSDAKLYTLGGGWNILNCVRFPWFQNRIGIAAVISVPYTETNRMHKVQLWLQDEDDNRLSLGSVIGADGEPQETMTIQGQFQLGRPAGLQAGDAQNLPFAVNLDNLQFPSPGSYSFVLKINDSNDENDIARLPFRVQFPNGVVVQPS